MSRGILLKKNIYTPMQFTVSFDIGSHEAIEYKVCPGHFIIGCLTGV